MAGTQGGNFVDVFDIGFSEATAEESLRLQRAFMRIVSQNARDRAIALIERMADREQLSGG